MFENIWIKVGVNMFNDTKAKIIDTYDKRDTIHYVWIRCMTLAGAVNDNGYLYINQDIPYTIKTLAIEFNRSIEEVKYAIKVLKKLQMIEYTEDKFLKVKNWTRYQNVDALEKLRIDRNNRVAKHRAKIKNEKTQEDDKNNVNNNNKSNIENNNNNNCNARTTNVNDSATNISSEENTKLSGKDLNRDSSDIDESNIDNNINNKLENERNVTNENINLNNNVTCNEDDLNCNVTKNNEVKISNVTVTDKIKSKKKTNKKKIEIESDNEQGNSLSSFNGESEFKELADKKVTFQEEVLDINNTKENPGNFIKNQEKSLENCKTQILNEVISEGSLKLAKYHEAITGLVGGLEHGKLRLAISMHGEANVKMAIDRAIESGKGEFNYINGILKNWRREGYPNQSEEIKNGVRSTGKNNSANKNKFTGFKPKKPRNLTDDERKGTEQTLI